MSQPCVLLLSMALDFGGAETHVISLAKALQKLGLRVIVASNGGRLVPSLDAAGIRHYTVALHARNPLALLGSIGVVKRIVQSEGVQLMHAHARIPAWVAKWVSRSTQVPLVTTYHGLYNPHWLLRLFTTGGDQTIAVSEDVREHLISKLGVPASQITVIHNGIDTEHFAAAGHPRDNHQILYISRLSGGRGGVALTLLEAVALIHDEFPSVQVVIVGEGDRLTEVRALAEELNARWASDFCHVLGARGDIPELLAEAGIVVGVGRVALEAMACGRPVIIAGEYGTYGLLEAETLPIAREHNFSGRGSQLATDPPTLAKILRQVLSDPDRAEKAAIVAQDMVQKHYSMTEKAREVVAVYAKVLPDLLARREMGL